MAPVFCNGMTGYGQRWNKGKKLGVAVHEEPYAQAMLDMAIERANGRMIKTSGWVWAGSAPLSRHLGTVFSFLSRGTHAQGADLIFETIPVTLICRHCRKQITLDIADDQPVPPVLARHLAQGCTCGTKKLDIINGLTVEMISLELL